jgi:hypothetical protein
MRHWLILGFVLAVVTATCSAQASPTPRVKHSQAGRTHSAKSVVVGKSPSASSSAELQRLEQQSAKVSATPRVKRTPRTAALLKTEKEKPTPPIRFSGAGNGAKGPGTTNQGTNPYKGRLLQKGSRH